MPRRMGGVTEAAAASPIDIQAALREPLLGFHLAGARVPIVGIRTWFNEIPHYQRLARHLGGGQPIVTIAPPAGRQPGDLPATAEEWASFCVRRLEEASVEPPYILLGWSFGGVVALEVARRLLADGCDIPRVVLIDTWLPGRHPRERRSFPHRMLAHLVHMLDLDTAARRAYVRERLAGRRAELAGWVSRWRARPAAPAPRTDPYGAAHVVTSRGDKMTLLMRAVWVAYLKYRAHPLTVATSLFRSASTRAKKGDNALGWTGTLLGDFEIVEVPGNHFSIFDEPNVATLAERIDRTLSADAGTPARTSAPIAFTGEM